MSLRTKLGHRLAGRKRQYIKWRETGLRGHLRKFREHNQAVAFLRKLRARVRHRRRGTLAAVTIRSTSGGNPHYGGSGDIMGQFVVPFLEKRGLARGSGKRTPEHNAAIGGSPTSDHLTTKLLTMARDFPTFSGEDDARALATAFGNSHWQSNSYASFDVVVDDYVFRVQILWGSSIGHGDHIHVGVSYVGRA